MNKRAIINLLELAAETKMPSGWLKEKAASGDIPCVQLTDSIYRFHRSRAVRAVERLVAKGVSWQPTADIIRERQHLASESAINGLIAYCYGGCEQSLIGDAISAAYTTPEEVNRAIYAELEGRELTDDAIDLIVLHHYLLLGIFRGLQAKTSGQLMKGGAEHA